MYFTKHNYYVPPPDWKPARFPIQVPGASHVFPSPASRFPSGRVIGKTWDNMGILTQVGQILFHPHVRVDLTEPVAEWVMVEPCAAIDVFAWLLLNCPVQRILGEKDIVKYVKLRTLVGHNRIHVVCPTDTLYSDPNTTYSFMLELITTTVHATAVHIHCPCPSSMPSNFPSNLQPEVWQIDLTV
jgi:hypothetical protein